MPTRAKVFRWLVFPGTLQIAFGCVLGLVAIVGPSWFRTHHVLDGSPHWTLDEGIWTARFCKHTNATCYFAARENVFSRIGIQRSLSCTYKYCKVRSCLTFYFSYDYIFKICMIWNSLFLSYSIYEYLCSLIDTRHLFALFVISRCRQWLKTSKLKPTRTTMFPL